MQKIIIQVLFCFLLNLSQQIYAVESIASKAINSAKNLKFQEAVSFTKSAKNKDLESLIAWIYFYETECKNYNFHDIASFIYFNGDLPLKDEFLRKAEHKIHPTKDKELYIKLFSKHTPVTGFGKILFFEHKYNNKQITDKVFYSAIKNIWHKEYLTKNEEDYFLSKHKSQLKEIDYKLRISNLIWSNNLENIERLMKEVSHDYKKLYQARIKLKNKSSVPNDVLYHVPKHLRNNEALVYDVIKWHLNRGHYDQIAKLLKNIPKNSSYKDKWWEIKHPIIRTYIKERKNYSLSYELAKNHGAKIGTQFADGEFLAGWIALKFLNNPKLAYEHFSKLYNGVNYPQSKSRAAYWAGLAAEKLKNKENADQWFKKAGIYFYSFYGQLANEKVRNVTFPEIQEISPTEKDIALFNNKLNKITRYLMEAKDNKYLEYFYIKSMGISSSAGYLKLLCDQAVRHNKHNLSVLVAKKASYKNILISNYGYPELDATYFKTDNKVELAYVFGIIRQESNFDQYALSKAGAMGLMQIMPATAQELSKRHNVKYEKRLLVENPYYNVKLGSKYIGDLLEYYNGSYILSIAAYNAGSGNVNKWLKNIGDPRQATSTEKIIDWIESIPFGETRNYVQRVLENIQYYRFLINRQENNKLMLAQDLRRGKIQNINNSHNIKTAKEVKKIKSNLIVKQQPSGNKVANKKPANNNKTPVKKALAKNNRPSV